MLVLKGNRGKSRVVDIIYSQTYSRCFIYNDYPLMEDSIYLDSSEYSLNDLKECIVEYHDNSKEYSDVRFDYLIIYTNETEESLTDFIEWLKENIWKFNYRDAFVMCQ